MTIRDEIAELVNAATQAAQKAGEIPSVGLDEPSVERPARPEHGDYATSLPLKLARSARQPPMMVAETLARHLPPHPAVGETSVAAPGFLNFHLANAWLAGQVNDVLRAGPDYAASTIGSGRSVQVEFVSANPTGPLHVGNGRWASIGDSLARVLSAAGYRVEREYLVNDELTQVGVFARTVHARYKQLFGRDVSIPDDGYPGEYVVELAKQIRDKVGDRFLAAEEPPPELKTIAVDKMIAVIRDDLEAMNVHYDSWFLESSLYSPDGTYPQAMTLLREQGAVVEREGAVWLASSTLGEDKDNVLVRSSGVPTYFASDIAYHYDKFFRRGFDQVIDIWGADHQGHVSRVKTAVSALGVEDGRLQIIIGQLVGLKRSGQTVRFSKRAGEIVTLREVIDEVGTDACRFFFLQRSADSQMDFDIDLAKRQSSENPVFYVQYAHARSAGILAQAAERGFDQQGADVSLLRHPAELTLLRKMLLLPELVESIAENHEPHHLPHYALDLATTFHDFYEKCRVLDPAEPELTRARLRLITAAKQVLASSLELMGMSAPEKM
jgi:arginyl-tRNA synthetase